MVCVHRHPKSLYGIDRSTAANNLRPSCIVLGAKKSSTYSSLGPNFQRNEG
jgi:hypothetical protein